MENEFLTSATLVTAAALMGVGIVTIQGDFALVYWMTLVGFIACVIIVQTCHGQGRTKGIWLFALPRTNAHVRDMFLIVDIFTLISMFEWTVWLIGQLYLFMALVVQLYILTFSTLKVIDAAYPDKPPLRERAVPKTDPAGGKGARIKAELELEANNYENMWRGGMPPGG